MERAGSVLFETMTFVVAWEVGGAPRKIELRGSRLRVGCRAHQRQLARTNRTASNRGFRIGVPLQLQGGVFFSSSPLAAAAARSSRQKIKFAQESPDLSERSTRARQCFAQEVELMQRGLVGEIALVCMKSEGGWPLASMIPSPWVGPHNSPYNGTRGISDEGCHMQRASRARSSVLPKAPRIGGSQVYVHSHISAYLERTALVSLTITIYPDFEVLIGQRLVIFWHSRQEKQALGEPILPLITEIVAEGRVAELG